MESLNFNFEMSRNFWSKSWGFYIKLEDAFKLRKPFGLTESRIDFLKINVDKKLETTIPICEEINEKPGEYVAQKLFKIDDFVPKFL